jgi:hypothetical protein
VGRVDRLVTSSGYFDLAALKLLERIHDV